MDLRVLLASTPDRRPTLHMVRHTLDKMADGGIYDHLGGGFARYSRGRLLLARTREDALRYALLAVYLEAPGDPRPELPAWPARRWTTSWAG
jgi:hypothetical protein